jgi:hypothetical protein
MQGQGETTSSDEDRRLERAVVLEILRDDHDMVWSLGDLEHELGGPDTVAIGKAVDRLNADGVLELSGATIRGGV